MARLVIDWKGVALHSKAGSAWPVLAWHVASGLRQARPGQAGWERRVPWRQNREWQGTARQAGKCWSRIVMDRQCVALCGEAGMSGVGVSSPGNDRQGLAGGFRSVGACW